MFDINMRLFLEISRILEVSIDKQIIYKLETSIFFLQPSDTLIDQKKERYNTARMATATLYVLIIIFFNVC